MSDDRSTIERLAVLEEQVESLSDDVQAMSNQMAALTLELARYKGFVGGIVLIVSCLWAFLSMFVGDLRRFFGGG